MESKTSQLPDLSAASPSDAAKPSAQRRSGGGWLAGLFALIALGAAGYAVWRVEASLRQGSSQQGEQLARLEDRIEQAGLDDGQLRKDVDALRARWRDADTVNKGIREEMLSLAERSRHLDNAIANLAEQRMGGRDALALNEAEFLLLMGQSRYELFGEADAALTAYQLADSALAASEDPVFASVRLTIGAEINALQGAQTSNANATLSALGKLRDDAASWPARRVDVANDVDKSRFARVFASFIRIRHDDDALSTRDPSLARSLLTVDLQAAAAAWLARDNDAYRTALSRASTGITASYGSSDAAVAQALAEIERLKALPIAAAQPVLGTALKELRDLRANRALSRSAPEPAMPLPAEIQPIDPAAPAPEPVEPVALPTSETDGAQQ